MFSLLPCGPWTEPENPTASIFLLPRLAFSTSLRRKKRIKIVPIIVSSTSRILLTSATGYVSGTILDHLIKNEEPSIQGLTFDLLVRSEEAAKKLREAYGDRVNPIQWAGLTDIPFITETASKYDIIVNTGSGFIADGAKAFVHRMARRIKPGNPVPWLLHIAGCTNLGDRPLTETAYPDREWDDAGGNAVYGFLKAEDAETPLPSENHRGRRPHGR